ncbi:MAG TPA: hypothetical protein VM223_22720 [Planctomycetota bacterium]|nr:hypothetical protein [Planctomycetota bacterium]
MKATGFLKGLSVLTVSILLAVLLHTDSRADGQPDAAARAKAIQLFSAAPAAFIENTGQIDDPSIRYVFNGSGANVFHTTSGPVFQVFQRTEIAAVGADLPNLRGNRPPLPLAPSPRPQAASLLFSASFPGARQINPVGRQLLETKINYCLGADHGKWREGVPTFGVVVYEGLYDGIDLHTYGRRSNLKYEFHVAPGADWRQIRIRYTGIAGLSLADNGSLIVALGDGWGSLTDDAPVIYQQIAGKRVNLPGRFVLIDARTYSFEIDGAVDPSAPLVIDPELAWSTYVGGSGNGVAVDASGNVVVTGGIYTNFHDGIDAFVTKLTPSGGHLWSTYLRGWEWEVGYGVAVDASNNVVVSGWTSRSGWLDMNGNSDDPGAFVAKLSSSGALVWSTFLGERTFAEPCGCGVAVDASGNVVVAGASLIADYFDVFVAKLSSSGEHLWSTYLVLTCVSPSNDAEG